MIGKMQLDIETLQKEQDKYHDVFKTLMKETKASILKKIKEIEDGPQVQPKKLQTRLSDPTGPLQGQQDRHFPAADKLSYDNYLVAVNEIPNDYYEY